MGKEHFFVVKTYNRDPPEKNWEKERSVLTQLQVGYRTTFTGTVSRHSQMFIHPSSGPDKFHIVKSWGSTVDSEKLIKSNRTKALHKTHCGDQGLNPSRKRPVNVFLIGGFGESSYLFSEIHKSWHERSVHRPNDSEVRGQNLLSQCEAIAHALAWLHNRITLGNGSAPCSSALMDLKPSNILIVDSLTLELWKISNFGTSVKRLEENEKNHVIRKSPLLDGRSTSISMELVKFQGSAVKEAGFSATRPCREKSAQHGGPGSGMDQGVHMISRSRVNYGYKTTLEYLSKTDTTCSFCLIVAQLANTSLQGAYETGHTGSWSVLTKKFNDYYLEQQSIPELSEAIYSFPKKGSQLNWWSRRWIWPELVSPRRKVFEPSKSSRLCSLSAENILNFVFRIVSTVLWSGPGFLLSKFWVFLSLYLWGIRNRFYCRVWSTLGKFAATGIDQRCPWTLQVFARSKSITRQIRILISTETAVISRHAY
jgi:hypothetical protein